MDPESVSRSSCCSVIFSFTIIYSYNCYSSVQFINKMQNANKMVNKNAVELLKNTDGNFKDDWIWDVFSCSRSSNYYLYKLFSTVSTVY